MNHKVKARYLDDGMAVTPKPQLVVRLYERLTEDLVEAAAALDVNGIERAHNALVHAQDIVHELNLSLNPDVWDGAESLRSIYAHVLARLLEANRAKSAPIVHECIELVQPLAEAWQEALLLYNGSLPVQGSGAEQGGTSPVRQAV